MNQTSDLPPQGFHHRRDTKCSQEAPNGKYGDSGRPQQGDRLCAGKLAVPLHPCPVVHGFYKLHRQDTDNKSIENH